jgi:hypothetical protein
MAKPTETRAPVRAAKSPTARRRAAQSGNGRAPRGPVETRRAPYLASENTSEADARCAPEAEPTQALSAPPASAAQVPASPAAEPSTLPSEPIARDQSQADRPTGAVNEVPPGQRAKPAESASSRADR